MLFFEELNSMEIEGYKYKYVLFEDLHMFQLNEQVSGVVC